MKNNLQSFLSICRESGIQDETLFLLKIQEVIEDYFGKMIYIDQNLNIFFSENNKKISISEKLLIEHELMNKQGELYVSVKETNSLLEGQRLPLLLLYEKLED